MALWDHPLAGTDRGFEMSASIAVRNFSFEYQGADARALKNVNFEIMKGDFFCIIGANGAGKSTLCNAFVGLVPHYFSGKIRGDILVEGKSMRQSTVAQLSETIGLVFQNPFNQLSYTAGTVAEELAYSLGNRGIAYEEMERRVQDVARMMRIDDILDRNPAELSGGQVQRVAFGSTFIMQPEILVLDECTTQLDPMGGEEIFDIVRRLNERGVTIVMVDHDMERVAEHADKVMVLDRGKVAALGTPQEVFSAADLDVHGVEAPDFLKITRSLYEAGMSGHKPDVTQSGAIDATREALC